jgi:hypothetical protein
MRTLESIAQEWGVDVTVVRRWVREGDLVAFRRGRVTRVHEDDLERFRRANTWRGEGGARARSVGARSGATASDTTTGGPSYLEGLESIRRERKGPSERGSRSSSIIRLHSA